MQLGEIAKAYPEVAIGSYPFFNPQQQECGARARDAEKLAQAKRAIETCWSGGKHSQIAERRPLTAKNRGSSPLGSANEIKHLLQDCQLVSNNCPINVYG
jgi:hypothetical protein